MTSSKLLQFIFFKPSADPHKNPLDSHLGHNYGFGNHWSKVSIVGGRGRQRKDQILSVLLNVPWNASQWLHFLLLRYSKTNTLSFCNNFFIPLNEACNPYKSPYKSAAVCCQVLYCMTNGSGIQTKIMSSISYKCGFHHESYQHL